MNTLILGRTDMTYGEYRDKLNIKDKDTFDSFLEEMKTVHTERIALEGETVSTATFGKIIKTLECFNVELKEEHPDMFIINNLKRINNYVFSDEKTKLETLLWITKEMTEEIADLIDEDIRHNGFIDIELLCNVRDFILNTHVKVENYYLVPEKGVQK